MSPSPAPARSADTRHAGLERDDVVDAALAMVEEGGADALSMRKLASELGVTTTTVYWHVGSRDELVLALIARQAERQATAVVEGDTPRERVMSAATNIWRSALAHRNVTALASQVGATTLLELPLEVALVAELEDAGVVGPAAADALRAVLSCVAGFLIAAWRTPSGATDDLHPAALWAAVDDGVVSARTRAAMAKPSDLDALFTSTVRAVVDAHVPAVAHPSGNRRRTT
jgi:AcrR family transcriptional regulator